MHNGMKKAAVLLLALTMLLSACTSTGGGKAVAKVNGEEISEADFEKEFAMHKKLYTWQYGEEFLTQPAGDGTTMETQIKKQVLNLLVMYRLIENDLEKNNITITDEEVQASIDSVKESMEGEEGYNTFKEQTKFTDEEFKEYNRQNLMYQKHMEMYNEQHPIDDAVIEETYNANKQQYDTITASHILVASEDEAKAAKERIDNGEAFEDVAKDVSTDGSAAQGGDLGTFGYTAMIPEFADAAFALEVGEVSDPVESQYGWHVITVREKSEGLDAVREQITAPLQTQSYSEYLTGLEEEYEVERLMEFEEATEAPETQEDTETDADEPETNTETDTETTEADTE